MLFQIDLTGAAPAQVFRQFWADQQVEQGIRGFSERLVCGVIEQQAELDRRISEAAEHWRLGRMAVVDRNVLRMAAYELLHASEDTPSAVVIDEAIEVAKKYGSEESGSFINGVLDAIRRRVESGSLPLPGSGGDAPEASS
jgi:N utilization substance protein B